MDTELETGTSAEEVTPIVAAASLSPPGEATATAQDGEFATPSASASTTPDADTSRPVPVVDSSSNPTDTEVPQAPAFTGANTQTPVITDTNTQTPTATETNTQDRSAITETISSQESSPVTTTPAPAAPAEAITLVPQDAKKPARLTEEQIRQLDLARRADGKGDDWVTLYHEEFPKHEQRDVEQLRGYIFSGAVAMHETRDKDGQLITWSMSQHYKPVEGASELAFWLGCYTVTKRTSQSTGIGRVHFPRVIEALQLETPDYIGRLTEIESTAGLPSTSQPVRRARFYQSIGLQELDIDYEIPLYQAVDATEYVPAAKRGTGIKGQLLISPFREGPINGKLVRAILKRIYEEGYNVQPDDPYIAERLALVDEAREDFLVPLRILSAAQDSSSSSKPEEQSK